MDRHFASLQADLAEAWLQISAQSHQPAVVGWGDALTTSTTEALYWYAHEIEQTFRGVSAALRERGNDFCARWAAMDIEWNWPKATKRPSWNAIRAYIYQEFALVLMKTRTLISQEVTTRDEGLDEGLPPSGDRTVIVSAADQQDSTRRGRKDIKQDGTAKYCQNSTAPASDEEEASHGTKRLILVTLFSIGAVDYETRQNSDDIERGCHAKVKAQTIRKYARWLIENGYIERSIESGNSGYWLTSKGKRLARKRPKSK